MEDKGRAFLYPGASEYAATVTERTQEAKAATSNVSEVEYGPDPAQRLDVYRPQSSAPDNALPVLVFLHGGAWRNGSKEWVGFMAPPVIKFPAIFVAVSYRLTPRHKFPAQMEDTLAALAWVYENIAGYGGDRDSIYIGGHSAGGNLASLAALRQDLYSDYALPLAVVKACFPISAPFDLVNTTNKALEDYLASRSDRMMASPIHWVNRRSPPFFLSYGEKDLPHILDGNRTMIECLESHSVPTYYMICPGASHFDTHSECVDVDHPWLSKVRTFMTTSLNLGQD